MREGAECVLGFLAGFVAPAMATDHNRMVVSPLPALKNVFLTKNSVVRIFDSLLLQFMIKVNLNIENLV